VGPSRILGAQIAFDPAWSEEAAGQRLAGAWRTVFDARDDRAFAAAGLAAKAARAVDDLACETLLVALARHLGWAYAGAERRTGDAWLHPAALARVVERLRASRGRDLSLSDLAREAGLGVSAFSRAFRGATGRTPMAFALDLRLDHAERLLAHPDLDLGRISAETGFASASHLVRSFRLRRGETPGHRRRRLLGECHSFGETAPRS
jgi:transcriptional regulator GlxA family with amidase domain